MNNTYKISFVVLVIMLLTPATCRSQVTEINMSEAVAIALANNPGIRASQLAVQQQKVLKKSAIDFADTRVNYTRGELNSRIIDYEVQIRQDFKLNYGAQANLQKEQIKLQEASLGINKSGLIRDVRSAFTLWQLSLLKLTYIDSLDSLYLSFAKAAELRYRSGESNMLEKTASLGKRQEVVLMGKQVAAEVSIYSNLLHKLLNTNDSLSLASSAETRFGLLLLNDSSLGSNPQLHLIRQQVNFAAQNLSTEKSKFIPTFSVSYINQQIDGEGNHGAFSIGTSLPILFWAKQGRSQAAKVGVEIAEATYHNNSLRIAAQFQQLNKSLENFSLAVDYYETQGINLSRELIKFGTLGYKAGEIGYVEYIRNIDQATKIQLKYVESLKNYNLTIIELQSLLGQ
jgi:cobalt-zinc-cadmium resistance protein CzcA